MKAQKTKHRSPLQLIGSLFLLGGFSILSLAHILAFGGDELGVWPVIVSIAATVMMGVSLVFSVLTLRKKGLRTGDEYTTRIMRKAGFWSFFLLIALLGIMFAVFQIAVTSHAGFEGMLSDLLNIKLVISIVVMIEISGILLFALLFYVFSKKGDIEDV